ncbi:MAG: ABC transporter substrate-binding protein [Chloroflexi bacterium]|nr:ABC transporter substrate-binding protein [Chloroflexota bacterium]
MCSARAHGWASSGTRSCHHPQQRKSVKFTLNFLAGGPQAGFMYAKKLGYYDEVGLDVTIEEGQGSATTAQLVATGGTQIGFADAPSAMQVRARGGAIKIVAVILQTNAFAIISLKEKNITRPKDLEGATVAVQPGTAQTTLLDAVFAANNVDKSKVNLVNIDPAALVGALIERRVDAILAGADFQSVQIRDRGYQINEMFYRDIGVPTVGLSVVVNEDLIRRDPDLIRRFVAASLRGWDAAAKNPEAAAQAVVEQFVSGDKAQILKQLEVDLRFLCAPGAERIGMPPSPIWNQTFELLVKYQGFPSDKPITDYYTTDFLPADAPRCPTLR